MSKMTLNVSLIGVPALLARQPQQGIPNTARKRVKKSQINAGGVWIDLPDEDLDPIEHSEYDEC